MLSKSSLKIVTGSGAQDAPHVAPFPRALLIRAKPAFTTRRVPAANMKTLITGDVAPRQGDLVLARVERIRQHARLELPDGRRNRLFPNDLIIVVYGNRYAPDQFEALIPADLGPCDLVAGGGIAAAMRQRGPKVKPPTRIVPLALVGDPEGERLSLSDFSLPRAPAGSSCPVIVIAGTSMNSGKTTTAAHLIKAFDIDGFRVGAAKVTGTGSGGDLWHFADAGAAAFVDFTDAGLPSTYGASIPDLEQVFGTLIGHLQGDGAEIIIVEIADGLLQAETKGLLQSRLVRQESAGAFFAAGDALSALAGARWLERNGYRVFGISGLVSATPLSAQEVRSARCTAVIEKDRFLEPGFATVLFEQLRIGAHEGAVAARDMGR